MLRAAAGIAGVILLLRVIDLSRALRALRDTDLPLVVGGTALTAAGIVCTVAGWGVALRGMGHRIGWSRLTHWYLESLFLGHIAPSGAAGDALRVVQAGRVAGWGAGLASLAASRLANTLGMALFGVVGALLLYSTAGAAVLVGAVIFAVAMILCWVLAFRLELLTRSGPSRLARVSRVVTRSLAPMAEALGRLRRARRLQAACLLIGAAGWAVNLLALQAFAAAVGIHTAWTVLAVAAPVSLVAATIPLGIRGIGVREGALVGMLAYLGVDSGRAAALAILLDLQLVPFALLGGALLGRPLARSGRRQALRAGDPGSAPGQPERLRGAMETGQLQDGEARRLDVGAPPGVHDERPHTGPGTHPQGNGGAVDAQRGGVAAARSGRGAAGDQRAVGHADGG